MTYGPFGSSLRDLPRLRDSRRRRASSWDRTGGNADRLTIDPGTTVVLAEIDGPASIDHIWCTAAPAVRYRPDQVDTDLLRSLSLRITWDRQDAPSVWVPLGDFFGVGHGRTVNFVSAPLQMSPQGGRSFNSWFHMPFAEHARVELVSDMTHDQAHFYYYIDYEEFDELGDGLGYFHAQWNRENPTEGVDDTAPRTRDFHFGGVNLTGDGNYVILDAEGRGHYVGCVLNVRSLTQTTQWNWYGEGDDMIFVDGEPFPPSLHGTGTEDYFNTAWCPTEAYSAPYHGITLPGGPDWNEPVSLYRFHVEDPVPFRESIRVTIEHGHANRRTDDISSVAYWYQTLPHRPFTLPPLDVRLPYA